MKKTKVIHSEDRKVLDLRSYMRANQHPVLCIGPMSQNCVEAVIRLANRLRQPIPLIASRRQIECEEFGGGYVNGWTTESFAEYVKSRDNGYVHLCRDHGGPWQGNGEADLSTDEAMARAKLAMLQDICNGFDVIHIDPSLRGGALTDPATLDKIFELYTFVCDTARQLGRHIEIEIGAEQQSGHFSDPQELVSLLREVTLFCEKENYQRPLFCVVQTGTLVKEMRNVGLTEGRKNEQYDQKYAVETLEKSIQYLSDIAFLNGVYVKEHNGDYLSDGSMAFRQRLKVGGINIAPELGVFESKCLVSLAIELGNMPLAEKMLRVFYDSMKWEKWLSNESKATDMEKALIAGHYTFAYPEFSALKNELRVQSARQCKLDLDEYLIENLMSLLKRMLWNAGYFYSLGLNIAAETGENLDEADRPIL